MNYDKDFLRELDLVRNRFVYVRITALQLDESPIETIEGKVTSGSINKDGASSLRRSFSLTMVAQDVDISNYYWGMNTKIKLEVGLKNTINPNQYGDIIWFNQGIYIITTFSTSLNANNFTINISGKDKMCLLNGEVGGTINATTDFGQYEYYDEENDVTVREKYEIKDIIRDSVHQYAGEPFWNIVINDVDDLGLELLEYRYDDPMYLLREYGDDTYFNYTFNGGMTCYLEDGTQTTIDSLEYYDLLVSSLEDEYQPDKITFTKNDNQTYCVAKIEYGQTAGYRTTPLVFAGDLIAEVGESFTSVLDKIVNMLGEFEYFYDLDGRFVFQRKKTYVNTTWSPQVNNEDEVSYVESLAVASSNVYTFNGTDLITAVANNPNLLDVRNDYTVWGARKGVSGADLPVHIRYAIDEKPERYRTIEGTLYSTGEAGNIVQSWEKVPTFHPDWWRIDDWAELYKSLTGEYPNDIMQKYAPLGDQAFLIDDLLQLLTPEPQYAHSWDSQRNSYVHVIDVDLNGQLMFNMHGTGCNHNYSYFLNLFQQGKQISYIYKPHIPSDTEITFTQCDWREIIYQMSLDYRKYNHGIPESIDPTLPEFEVKLAQQNYPLYQNGKTGYEQYYIDMEGFWRQLYNPYPTDDEAEDYYDMYSDYPFWNKTVYEHPETLNFWFDFMPPGELDEYSVKMIGDRPKVVKETSIKSIYYRETPMIIFSTPEKMGDETTQGTEERMPGYRYFSAPDLEAMFSISSQGVSAKDKVDEFVYNYGYATESCNITAIPIYYLEPNTRISIFDDQSGINGEYVISRINISLTYNGLMSLSATKAADTVDGRRVM